MKLRDLFVSIGFDVDDKQLNSLDRSLAKTKGLILAVAAGAAAGAAGLFALTKSVADAGDKAAKAAGRMGIGVELLQEYQYAAQLAGMQVGELNGNMEQFIRRSAEAVRGSGEAKAAYAELGIEVRNANGQVKSADRLLAEVADRFAQIEDGSKKVRLAYALFGRSGVGMINMLNQGSAAIAAQREEARRLGIVLSDQAARDAEAFNDEMLRVKSVIGGVKNELGAGLMPVVTDLLVQFRRWVMAHRELIRTQLEKMVRGLIVVLRGLWSAAGAVVGVLADIVEMFGGMERAAKAAAWALGLVVGLHMLSMVGSLVVGLGKLTAAIRIMGNAALIANLKAAAIPVLIGAAVLAAILAIQDLYAYVKGEKSLYGHLIDKWLADYPLLQKVLRFTLGDAIGWIKEQWEKLPGVMRLTIGDVVDWIKERWGELVTWMAEQLQLLLGPLLAVKAWLHNLDAKRRFVGAGIEEGFEKARQWLWGGGPMELIHNVIGAGPQGAPAARGSAVNNSNVSVNAPVTITVPSDTPVEQVGRAVREGISDAFDRMLRDTAWATIPAVEH